MKDWEQDLKEIISNWHLYPDNTMRCRVLKNLIESIIKYDEKVAKSKRKR